MKKIVIVLFGLLLIASGSAFGAAKELEIQGKKIISQRPAFALTLPWEFRLMHSFSVENRSENSLTRTSIFIKEKNKQVEEMLIIQLADKTNPEAGPMTVPPLKPYSEKRMYLKGKTKKKEVEIDYLIQLMAWNPEAPSLQPVIKKGITLPSHWALQGQILFVSEFEHGVFIRYSKDVNSFGFKVSVEGEDWNRASISGNQKRTFEAFQKIFMEMMDSIQIKD